MSASSGETVFLRAAGLAQRAGACEIDVDLLLLALDFEAGPAQPPDLAKVDALLSRYTRNEDKVSPSHTFGGVYASGWIGLSNEVRAAIEPLGSVENITISDLRKCLLAAKRDRI